MEEIKKFKNIVIGANTLQEPVLMKDAWLYVHLLTSAVS